MKQYLENKQGKSSKFWEIELDGQFLTIQNGKIGGKGRLTKKDLKTEEKALLAFKREIIKKKKSGYEDPAMPIIALDLENTPFNDTIFKHEAEVEHIYYYEQKGVVVTASRNHFYLWQLDGTLLDQYAFAESTHFFGSFFVQAVPNSEQLLIYKKDTYRDNHIYLFDCTQYKLELIREQLIEIPIKGYFGDIDVDENYIYLGYTGGFMLLDYEFNTLKTLVSPQNHNNSSGTVVSAVSQRIAFIEYGGRESLEQILIMDLDGNEVAQFEAKAHGSNGIAVKFNATGTILYTVSAANYETKAQLWEVEKGNLLQELVNYSSSGGVLSFEVSRDDKWLAIRVAGVDIILWNVEETSVAWVKTNEALWANIAFGGSETLYQSAGNRLQPIGLESGEPLLVSKGLTAACRTLYIDDAQNELWTMAGKIAHCFEADGSVKHALDIESFAAEKASGKLLLKRRYQNYGGTYAWFDLKTGEETPILSGLFESIDFDERRLLSTSGYFSREKKMTKLWSHSGRELQAFKPSKNVKAYLWKDDEFVVVQGKTLEFWTMGEKKASLVIKNAHSKGIQVLHTFPNCSLVLSIADNEIKLWDGKSTTSLFFDLALDTIKTVLKKDYLSELLIVDKLGNVYVLEVEQYFLKQIANLKQPITTATLSRTGILYAATEELEILKTDLSSLLQLKQEEKKASSTLETNTSILNGTPTEKEVLRFLKSMDWKTLDVPLFLRLRSALEKIAIEDGVGAAHEYFTERMLESGALLRHSFAHEEKINSFAMSPDGQYLAVGTWVGDNYEEDGTVQIWETATGRCVNLLKESYGGIGWPDYPDMLQWSASSRYIGAGLNTNTVAKLNPFSDASSPLASASVTNGWSRPPAWTWQGNKDAFVISCWHNSEIPLAITSNKRQNTYEDNAKWMSMKLAANIKPLLNGNDLQPYKWCRTTPDGRFAYGYNYQNQVYGVDLDSKQVVWLKSISQPVGFSACNDRMVYQDSDKLVWATIQTGEIVSKTSCLMSVKGIQFSKEAQRCVVYGEKTLLVYEAEKQIARWTLNDNVLKEAASYSELRSVQFNQKGDKLVVLLESGKAQVWSIEGQSLLSEFAVTAEGIYWGNTIVGVNAYGISFYKEDGTCIQSCDKDQETKAYNALYDQARPLQVGKKDFSIKYDVVPNYPLDDKGRKQWIAVVPTGVVIGNDLNVDGLDQHLAYVYENKYAWSYCWGSKKHLYTTLYEAKEDPKLGLTSKEKALIKAPKKTKPKKAGISFSKGGSLLDIVQVHQKSLAELKGGWHYHISKHNGIIARQLIKIGAYKKAIKIAAASSEPYVLVSNLGFVAVDLAQNGVLDLAKEAFEKGVNALENMPEKDRNDWAATFVYAPLAAAAALLGLSETSKTYFDLSYQKIEKESNTFEKYTHLATSYLLCHQHEKAMDVMSNGPWNEGWFSSYQVQFILLLMDLGHLDLAMEYFDLGIQKCGKIDEFDLLDKGFEALLEQKRYQEAIAWMEKFPGLSTSHCEALLIQKYIEVGEKELGTDYLLTKMEASKGYDGSVMEYLKLMSYINPEKAKESVLNYTTTTNAYYKDRYYEDLGRTKSNLGLVDDGLLTSEKISDVRNRVLYLVGLLECPADNTEVQLQILNQAIDLVTKEEMVVQETIKFCIELSKAASRLGKEDQANNLLEKANALANQSKADDRYSASELQKLYLDLELLEASYKMFKKQTPANRKYGMKDYALEIARKGYWKTAAALLMTIPAKDLNDRHAAAMKIIKDFNP